MPPASVSTGRVQIVSPTHISYNGGVHFVGYLLESGVAAYTIMNEGIY